MWEGTIVEDVGGRWGIPGRGVAWATGGASRHWVRGVGRRRGPRRGGSRGGLELHHGVTAGERVAQEPDTEGNFPVNGPREC